MSIIIGTCYRDFVGRELHAQQCNRDLFKNSSVFSAMYNVLTYDEYSCPTGVKISKDSEGKLRQESIMLWHKTAQDLIPGSTSDKPIVHDLFTWLAGSNPTGHFLFVNGDIELTEDLVKYITRTRPITATVLYRKNYDSNKQWTETMGQDGFLIDSGWWLNNKDMFKSYPNVLGEVAWDNAYAAGLDSKLSASNEIKHLSGLIAHRDHPVHWNRESVEGKYCAEAWTNCPVRVIWEGFNKGKIV